jgi:hypothetical protein
VIPAAPLPGAIQRSGPALLSAFLLIGSYLLFGCAAQAPPRPPRVEQPQQVTDLTVSQVGTRLELSFTPPLLAVDGERLSKSLEIEVFRFSGRSRQDVEVQIEGTRNQPGMPWKSFAMPMLSSAEGQKFSYADPLLPSQFAGQLGFTLAFRVAGITRGFRNHVIHGKLSDPAIAVLIDVSPPVTNLRITPTEHTLGLAWSAPDHTVTGRAVTTLAGYEVYKSTSGKRDSFAALARTGEPAYLDQKFEFGRAYFYKVRARFMQGSEPAESDDSQVVEITPRDIFPPRAPTGLTALYTDGSVELIWNANTEADLAGYNLYRRHGSEPSRRLNPSLLPTPIFADTSAVAGETYSYWVRAQDSAGNESPPSVSANVTAE